MREIDISKEIKDEMTNTINFIKKERKKHLINCSFASSKHFIEYLYF